MSAFLSLLNNLSLFLALVFSFSSWVLAAISIRWAHTVYASYFKLDPATIVCGIIAFLYALSLVVLRGSVRSSYLKTKTVMAVSTFMCIFFLAIAIAYSAMRNDGIYDCSTERNTPTGNIFHACGGLIKALQALTWIAFIFWGMFIATLAPLAKAHSSLPWTKENGFSTPIGFLNPAEPKTDGPAPKH